MLSPKPRLPLFAAILTIVVLTVAACTDSNDSADSNVPPAASEDTLQMDTASTRPVKTTN